MTIESFLKASKMLRYGLMGGATIACSIQALYLFFTIDNSQSVIIFASAALASFMGLFRMKRQDRKNAEYLKELDSDN